MADLTTIFHHPQRQLFHVLEAELGTLSALDQQFGKVISLTDLGRFTRRYEWCDNGAPPCPRTWLAHAFIAKHVYQFFTTGALLDALKSRPLLRQLCGWDSAGEIPSEPTFSRAFAAFAQDQLPQQIHEHMVKTHVGPKLVGHVSRDATAIEASERPTPKPPPAPSASKKHGRPRKDEQRPPPPPKRLNLQPTRTLEENLADLPAVCNVGTKRNSKGHQESWIGYKLHLDTLDGYIPASAVLTSASVHDSQVAIPLAQMTAQRVCSLYDMMDSAYDAPQILAFSQRFGHVPIIDPNQRSVENIPLAPAQAKRFKQRSASERVNSLLKERYGGRCGASARGSQGDVPFDVLADRANRERAVCAVVLRSGSNIETLTVPRSERPRGCAPVDGKNGATMRGMVAPMTCGGGLAYIWTLCSIIHSVTAEVLKEIHDCSIITFTVFHMERMFIIKETLKNHPILRSI